MDFETWWEEYKLTDWEDLTTRDLVYAAWQAGQMAGQAAEREAIYKIVESYFEEDNLNRQWNNACDAIARAIRERGEA